MRTLQKISLLYWDNHQIKRKPICLKPCLPISSILNIGQAIPWKKLEEAFAPRYGRVGLPSHPIRQMASLLMLKHLYNLSDERVVAHWETNQHFAGEATFQWSQPCAASDLVHFRHRLGGKGIEKLRLLQHSYRPTLTLFLELLRSFSLLFPVHWSTIGGL